MFYSLIAREFRKLKLCRCKQHIHKNCNELSEKEYNYAMKKELGFECILCFAEKFQFSSPYNNFSIVFYLHKWLHGNF